MVYKGFGQLNGKSLKEPNLKHPLDVGLVLLTISSQ